MGIVKSSVPAFTDVVTQKWKKFANGKKPGGALVKAGNATGSRTDWLTITESGSTWEKGAWSKRDEEKVRWRGEGRPCFVATELKQSASPAGRK